MKSKKLLCAALALCLAAGALVLPVSAAEVSTFSDITDPAVGEAVEVLRTMGVLSGVGGDRFDPDGTLSRAQFCKMAILIMGKGDEVAANETRTIFSDVASNHWARGYINLAVSTEVGDSRLILGVGDGKFAPSRAIKYSEAVTVLLRVLGYGQEANLNWPYGAVGIATSISLDDGLEGITHNMPIKRSQAALLFRNMLLAKPNGSTSPYVSTLGTVMDGSILLSLDEKTPEGVPGVRVSTMETAVRPSQNTPARFFLGKRGMAVLDDRGLLLTFIPERGVTSKTITVELATPTTLSSVDGSKLNIPSSAKVLRDGVETIYGEVYSGLNRPGLVVTVYYTPAGAVDYLYVGGTAAVSGTAMIASASGAGAFDAITNNSRTCTIIKNGAAVTQADLRAQDVGIYSEASDTLYVSDFRLTCVYSKASPNAFAPTTVTLMGRAYEILESAYAGLADVKVGGLVTALFTPDGRVAALLPTSSARANAMGIVRSGSTAAELTIDLVGAPAGIDSVTGALSPNYRAESFMGSLVSFSGSTIRSDGRDVEVLYLTRESSSASGSLNVSARTLGGTKLSDAAVIFEKVGSGDLTRISLADIAVPTVDASRVSYAHTNSLGSVDVVILNDVTGDRYTYGLVRTSIEETDTFGGEPVMNTVTTVVYGNGEEDRLTVVGAGGFEDGFGGVAQSIDSIGEYRSAAGFAQLTKLTGLTQTNFSSSSMRLTQGVYDLPIAADVKCYDAASGRWFSSLNECLIYTNSFTAYFDRTPASGGKVRIIVANT